MVKFEQLMNLALRSSGTSRQCACAVFSCAGWERVPISFPESQLRRLGTLIDDACAEPTFLEFHPSGSNYWSENAPIALNYFPYNRCSVTQCEVCGRAYLRYTESGGYYVEHRLRALNPALISDEPLA